MWKKPTEEESWEKIDEVVSLFMDGKTIAEVRTFTWEKYGNRPLVKATDFCFKIACSDCPLQREWKNSEVQLCSLLFPCDVNEWEDLL